MSQTPPTPHDPLEMYLNLRQIAFNQTRNSLGLPSATSPLEPFGVILEMGMDRGTATLIAFAEGSASIYLSTGGGYIGGQGQPNVNAAAKKAVAMAADFVTQMQSLVSESLPQPGQHVLYALTDQGLYGGAGPDNAFAQGQNALAPLWHACQDMITQYRLSQQKPPN